MSFVAGSMCGPFRIVRELGRGGMGAVFEALAPDGATVAIKVLLSVNPRPDVLARFEREAKVCSTLRHPHVVAVTAYGVDPDSSSPYIVMPRLRGEDLEELVTRVGPLEPAVASAIILQAAAGLDAAHAMGIVHRDVKPSNVYLERDPHGGLHAVVLDFGIAKVADDDGSLTASGVILGTPMFMAPEQLLDAKRVDSRSDTWSLAMTLYFALAGSNPYADMVSHTALLLALTQAPVPHLQKAAPWVDGKLARVVHAALLPRDQRFPSVHAFAEALREAVAPRDLRADTDLGVGTERRAMVATSVELPNTHSELADDDPVLGKTVGGYRVARRLGVGGMGAVYEASSATGSVALKVIHTETSRRTGSEALRRFVREARAAHAIDSPHVAKVIDAGTDATLGIPFIVMELLHGVDLSAMVRERGPLEPRAVAPLFVDACRGLAAAHAVGVVHRDIKPANLFLHEEADGTVTLKICDFGIAKQVLQGDTVGDASTELTRTGGMLGSPVYMSPEQARNAKNVDHRTDVWGLGLSMYEALSGRRPWEDATSMGELILAICTTELAPLASIAPWVPDEIAAVVTRALAREPADRWANAEEMGRALAQALGPTARVRRADLVAVDPSKHPARPVSTGPATTTTGTEVVVSARAPGRTATRRWMIGAAAALTLAGAVTTAALVFRQRGGDTSTASSATTSAPPPPVTGSEQVVPSASLAPLPIPTVVPSTGPRTITPPSTRPSTSATPSTTASAAASVPAPATSLSTGRGKTAVDIDFGTPPPKKDP